MSDDMHDILSETKRLEALLRANLVDAEFEEAFDRITRLASQVLNAPTSLVSLVEPERQYFKSYFGLGEPWASQRETPLSHSFCKHVAVSGDPLIVEDARENPLVSENLAIRDLNVIAYLGIPLTIPEGLHLGSLCVIDTKPRAWTEEEIDTMKVLAASVISEIQLRLEVKAKEEAIQQLNARNADLDTFAHTVSHNLKNPLSAIVGWSSVSARYSEQMSEKDLLEAIEKMGEMALQSNAIIDALLLAAGVSRSGQVQIQKLNMLNIIDDALARLQTDISSQNVVIQIQNEELFLMSYGYRPWLEEVWVNYISNAIKYGGNPPTIEFGSEQVDEDFVRYWIKDNGNGIAEDELDALFVPFSRLPQAANFEGHGLGLSVVLRIIKKLGGDVAVSSKVGKGSIFSFTLPSKPLQLEISTQ